MITHSVFPARTHRFLTAVLVAWLSLGISQAVWAQSAAAAAPHNGISATGATMRGGSAGPSLTNNPAALPSVATAKPESSQGDAGSINQGIKMHGHWVIDVKNPDGTIVQHRDFENSLVPNASQFLIGLMSGYFIPGDYLIFLQAGTGSAPCIAGTQGGCAIVRSLTTNPGTVYCEIYYCSTGLTYTYNLAGAGPFSMVLQGSITANQAGNIAEVSTAYNSCANIAYSNINVAPTTLETSSPSSCDANTTTNWYGNLSLANINPVTVASGQIIQVTVTITFS